MLLWAILTVIAVVIAVACTVPLVRRYEARPSARAAALTILGEQLADIDTQVAGGAIDPTQADALRTEVKRRMLTSPTAEAAARPLGPATLGRLAIGLAVIVAVAGTWLYTSLGRPDLATDPALAAAGQTAVAPNGASATAGNTAAAGTAATADIASMVTQLETRMKDNPNDAEGWRMLGWSYFQTSRFKESAEAYGKAVALTPTAPGFASAYGEALVQAAGGRMTKEALTQFRAANALDRQDARARYFLGVAKAEGGDRRGAVDDWLALLSESPADAPWAGELRRVILETAKADGRDVSASLGGPAADGPAAGGPAATAAPNPTPEQIQAVQALPQRDQQAMIRGMVDGLAAKLKANPKDPEGWVRLMRARLVLGDRAAAATAKRDAQAALAGDAAGTATVTQGAATLGL